MLEALGETYDYKFQLFILTRSGENAMSLPGGYIYLDKALLDERPSMRKARYALAHELAHVLQRHETRNAQARIIDSISLTGSTEDLVKTIRQPETQGRAVVASMLTGKLLYERHFADQELGADACGVRMLNGMLGDREELVATLQEFVDQLPSQAAEAAEPGRPPAGPTRSKSAATTVSARGSNLKTDDVIGLVTRPINRHPDAQARVSLLREMLAALRAGK
jgi:predicted Zn-dependent protease